MRRMVSLDKRVQVIYLLNGSKDGSRSSEKLSSSDNVGCWLLDDGFCP